MKVRVTNFTGLREVYRSLVEIESDSNFKNSTFKSYQKILIPLNLSIYISDIDILSLYFLRKMYGSNLVFDSVRYEKLESDDELLNELINTYLGIYNIDKTTNDIMADFPILFMRANASLHLKGSQALSLMRSQGLTNNIIKSFFINYTNGGCVEDSLLIDGFEKYLSEYKYVKNRDNIISENLINNLNKFIMSDSFENVDVISDYSLDVNYLSNFNTNNVNLISLSYVNSRRSYDIDFTSIDINGLTGTLKEIKESVRPLEKVYFNDNLKFRFVCKMELAEFFMFNLLLPIDSSVINFHTPFLKLINEENKLESYTWNKRINIFDTRFKEDLISRLKFLNGNLEINFILDLSLNDIIKYIYPLYQSSYNINAISYLSLYLDRDFNSIFKIANSIYNQLTD